MVTNQRCSKCKKKARIRLSYTKRVYCNNCFLELIEKRVRKELRVKKYFKPKEEICLLNDGSKEYLVAKTLLKNIFKNHLNMKETKKIIKHKKMLIPTNLDREVNKRINSYLENKKVRDNHIKILNDVLEEEIIDFCRIKKFKISSKDTKNSLIEDVGKKYPGTKFALAKSFGNLPKK